MWSSTIALIALVLISLGWRREADLAPAATAARIPSYQLAGGGEIPGMIMGGDEFGEWFKAAGRGAALQTFYSYGNGRHIGAQVALVGRSNVFISTGIPCGCCGSDSPR